MKAVHQLCLRLSLATACVLAAPAADAAREYRYVMLFSGHQGGEHITRIADDGSYSNDYSYRENGRGPDYHETLKLDRNGLLERFAISGKTTFGATVDERYEKKGDTAEWSGIVDHGSTTVKGPALYMPLDATIEVAGIGARALLHAPGKKLPAIPGGEVSIAKVADAKVGSGKAAKAVALYAIKGADLQPSYLWLSTADERPFATIFPGVFQLIAKGYEGEAARLEKRQLEVLQAEQRRVATSYRHPLKQPVLIRNARVFDAEKAVLGPAQDVYLDHGRIAAIYEAGSVAQQPGTVIDAGGRSLLPGLFDMHSHLTPGDFLLDLAAGVTTVRDMGNDNDTLARTIEQFDRFDAIGPHVVRAGFIEGKSPFNASNGILVTSQEEALKAVDYYAQHGFAQIKIYNSFKPEWVAATTAYAHQRGLRVSGHVPAFSRAEDVVRNGYDEIQHINQVLLNFFVKPDTDTRNLTRFTLVADNAGSLDMDGAPFRDFTKLLLEHKTVLDPTVAVFEGLFTQQSGELDPTLGPVKEHLPVTLRRSLYRSESALNEENSARWRASFKALLNAVARFHRAGVPLVAGTDSIPGFTLQRELELYVQAGIPANEALRIATWNAATYARQLADRGSITPGKRADLILVDGDPTADIGTLRKVALTLKDGDAYYPAELYGEMGVVPFTVAVKPEAATQ